MKRYKAAAILVFILLAASFLGSQSLVELSKKEKKRRAAFKGRGVVVTNKDLIKVKKKPGIIAAQPEEPPETPPEESDEEAAETSQSLENPRSIAPEDPSAEESAQQPEQESVLSDREFQRRKAEYEERWNGAQERVELLTLKMSALWQQFYSTDEATGRSGVQAQISETYSKLLQAQETAAKAKAELDDFIAGARREGVPAIWIR